MTQPKHWERNSRNVVLYNHNDCPICRMQIDMDHADALAVQGFDPQRTLPPAFTNPSFTIPPVGPVDAAAETTVVDFDLVQ